MRNKILLLLFALTKADLLDSVLPKTCPSVLTIYFCVNFRGLSLLFFRDQDIGDKCEGLCELEYVDCANSCSNSNCLTECARALTYCSLGNSFTVNEKPLKKGFVKFF